MTEESIAEEVETEFKDLWNDCLYYEKIINDFNGNGIFRAIVYGVAVSNLRIKKRQEQLNDSINKLCDVVSRLVNKLEVE